MPENPIFLVLFQQINQHVQDEIARRLQRLGISGNTIDASSISGNLSPSSVSLAAAAARVAPAGETLTAGNLITFNSSGQVLQADASANKPAMGFVRANVTSGNNGLTYGVGIVSGLSGRTVGATQYLSTSGSVTETPPSTSGYIVQIVGTAISSTEILFAWQTPTTLS